VLINAPCVDDAVGGGELAKLLDDYNMTARVVPSFPSANHAADTLELWI